MPRTVFTHHSLQLAVNELWQSRVTTANKQPAAQSPALLRILLPSLLLSLFFPLQGWAGSLSHLSPQSTVQMQAQSKSTSLSNRYQPVTDYAAWSAHNEDGSWTRAAEYAVANSELPTLHPADIQQFCPQYGRLPSQQRKQFWVGLLSAMSGPESNFRPASFYQERFHDRKGKPVVSRGLLQISQESANQQRYGCDIRHPSLLHDPVINLACGVRILSLWVKRDKLIASPAGSAPKGGGRYWSTLRHSNGKTAQISDFTRRLPICQGKTSYQRTAQQLAPQPARHQGKLLATRQNNKRNEYNNNVSNSHKLAQNQPVTPTLQSTQNASSSLKTSQTGGYIRLTGSKTAAADRKLPR